MATGRSHSDRADLLFRIKFRDRFLDGFLMDFDSKWDTKIWQLLAFLRPFSVLGAIRVPEVAKSVPGTSRSSFFGNFWCFLMLFGSIFLEFRCFGTELFDEFEHVFYWFLVACSIALFAYECMFAAGYLYLHKSFLLQVIFSCTSVPHVAFRCRLAATGG